MWFNKVWAFLDLGQKTREISDITRHLLPSTYISTGASASSHKWHSNIQIGLRATRSGGHRWLSSPACAFGSHQTLHQSASSALWCGAAGREIIDPHPRSFKDALEMWMCAKLSNDRIWRVPQHTAEFASILCFPALQYWTSLVIQLCCVETESHGSMKAWKSIIKDPSIHRQMLSCFFCCVALSGDLTCAVVCFAGCYWCCLCAP